MNPEAAQDVIATNECADGTNLLRMAGPSLPDRQASIYTVFWISMNKQMTNREIKRLELQIALLSNKLERGE